MSLYEWCLEVERYVRKEKKEMELRWVHTRAIIAEIYNVNRDTTKKPTPFKGSDFIRLSFDDVEEVKEVEEDGAEYFRRMKLKAGTKFKKDG